MKYTVTVHREGSHWLGHVEEIPGCQTFGRSLSGLDSHIREAIALMEDLEEGAENALEIHWNIPDAPAEVKTALDLGERRRKLEFQRAALDRDTKAVVKELSAHGWSRRDQALMTGLSYTRISQLA